MACEKIRENVYSVGVKDFTRRLFDELIPLPDGTSYNSYLIRGSEKIALIDTAQPGFENELLSNIEKSGVNKIDYIIANHAEGDHSFASRFLLEKFPGSKIVTNEKCRAILKDYLHIDDESFKIIKDGETLSLGNKNLEFIFAPWVHWPETMFTYLKEEAILFPCDFFGSHLATTDLFVIDENHVLRAAKRYYAEIMMPFRVSIVKHLEKLKNYKIDIIATSHGPIYGRPKLIIDAYTDWASDNVKNEVVIPYVSMYGSTKTMAYHLMECLSGKGIHVTPFDLTKTDLGELAMSIVDAATIVIGSPTVLASAHPVAAYAAMLVNALRPKTRFVSIIGSNAWGGKMVDQLVGMIGNLKVEILDPVIIKGHPRLEDLGKIEKLASDIYLRHSSLK